VIFLKQGWKEAKTNPVMCLAKQDIILSVPEEMM
jgi:hypothetical protein